jgi:hypothetical protein
MTISSVGSTKIAFGLTSGPIADLRFVAIGGMVAGSKDELGHCHFNAIEHYSQLFDGNYRQL